jgi:hypothetical protein
MLNKKRWMSIVLAALGLAAGSTAIADEIMILEPRPIRGQAVTVRVRSNEAWKFTAARNVSLDRRGRPWSRAGAALLPVTRGGSSSRGPGSPARASDGFGSLGIATNDGRNAARDRSITTPVIWERVTGLRTGKEPVIA